MATTFPGECGWFAARRPNLCFEIVSPRRRPRLERGGKGYGNAICDCGKCFLQVGQASLIARVEAAQLSH